ncbi:antibiotic biosynthesis monooxygenase [Conexibacter sp. DBS9H8]|uniref:antibiotic biosynthesis monooxygenase family protein n=1 Tax=Conexibacter sp. DBS9H8 TaxID=2937801 RepID=UPI0020101E45|nr:antibiotic biosynthesis monooxygenase [Conexibacter sp. DBS9H8]
MFVVLFEVQPYTERFNEYLAIAKLLRPELEAIDGFIDNTRFASARTPGRLLSLSTWRDEKSLIRWRTQATHHDQGQQRGRFEIFADYRLRVAEVTDDTHPPTDAPLKQSRYDETEIGAAKSATLLEPLSVHDADELSDFHPADGLVDLERYDGILKPHASVMLASWSTLTAAQSGTPPLPTIRVRHARIIREYGLQDRREAPQYYPDVA